MKVLFYSQIFELPTDNGSDRAYYFCRHLLRSGCAVEVITSNVDYKQARARTGLNSKEIYRKYGFKVMPVKSFSNFRGSYVKRIWFFLSFTLRSLIVLLKRTRDADCVYAVSTPLTVPAVAAISCLIFRKPLVVEITDVWPDAAIHVGVIKSSGVVWVAKLIERFVYRHAVRIICVTDGISKTVKDRVSDCSKVVTITNGVDSDLFNSSMYDQRDAIRLRLGVADKFVAIYLGAHGKYNSLDTIMTAAQILRDDPRVAFLLIGDGDEKARLTALAKKEALGNITFLDPQPRQTAIEMLGAADLCLLPNLAGPFYECNLPNKFFDYMASGRPVVVAGEVEAAGIVKKSGAGVVVDAEDGAQLAKAILEFVHGLDKDPKLRGDYGRQYILKEYSRERLAELFLSVLKESVGTS